MVALNIFPVMMPLAFESTPWFLQLSTKLLQEGHHEDLDRVIHDLETKQKREIDAAEAEIDSEEAGHVRSITQSIDEEHIKDVREMHKDIINKVRDCFNQPCYFLALYNLFLKINYKRLWNMGLYINEYYNDMSQVKLRYVCKQSPSDPAHWVSRRGTYCAVLELFTASHATFRPLQFTYFSVNQVY